MGVVVIDRVQVGAWRNDSGTWTIRVSYADTEDGNLFPPVRFWRGSKGSGPGPDESIGEVIFHIASELSDINYGPDTHGEPDPVGDYAEGASYASWASREVE